MASRKSLKLLLCCVVISAYQCKLSFAVGMALVYKPLVYNTNDRDELSSEQESVESYIENRYLKSDNLPQEIRCASIQEWMNKIEHVNAPDFIDHLNYNQQQDLSFYLQFKNTCNKLSLRPIIYLVNKYFKMVRW